VLRGCNTTLYVADSEDRTLPPIIATPYCVTTVNSVGWEAAV